MKDRLRTSKTKELTGKVINSALALTLVSGCMMPATAWAEASQSSDVVAEQLADESHETQRIDIADAWEQGELVIDHGGNYYLSRSFSTSGTLVLAVPEGETLSLDFCGHEVTVEGVVSAGIDVSQSRGEVCIADTVYEQASEEPEEGDASEEEIARGTLTVYAHGVSGDVFGVHGNFGKDTSPTLDLSDIEVVADVVTVDASIDDDARAINATAVFLNAEDDEGEPRDVDATLSNVSLTSRLAARDFTQSQIASIEEVGEKPFTASMGAITCGAYINATGVMLTGAFDANFDGSSDDQTSFGLYSTREGAFELADDFAPENALTISAGANELGDVVALLSGEFDEDAACMLDSCNGDAEIRCEGDKLVLSPRVEPPASPSPEAIIEQISAQSSAFAEAVEAVASQALALSEAGDNAGEPVAAERYAIIGADGEVVECDEVEGADYQAITSICSSLKTGQTLKLFQDYSEGGANMMPATISPENAGAEDAFTIDLNGYGLPGLVVDCPGSLSIVNTADESATIAGTMGTMVSGYYDKIGALTVLCGKVDVEGDIELKTSPKASVSKTKVSEVPGGSVAAVTARGNNAFLKITGASITNLPKRLNTLNTLVDLAGVGGKAEDGGTLELVRCTVQVQPAAFSATRPFRGDTRVVSATGGATVRVTSCNLRSLPDTAQCDAGATHWVAYSEGGELSFDGEIAFSSPAGYPTQLYVAGSPLVAGSDFSLSGASDSPVSVSATGLPGDVLMRGPEEVLQRLLGDSSFALGTVSCDYAGGKLIYEDGAIKGHIDYVASLGGTSYTSLQKALDAANEGDTITLLDGALIANTALAIDKSVTLDLAGASVQLANNGSAPAITVKSGTLTLMNSKPGEGGIQWTDSTLSSSSDPAQAAHAMQVDAGAKLVIDDAALDIHSIGGGNVVSAVVNAGSVELLHGADISLTCENGGGSTAYGVYEVGAATLNVAEDASVTVSTAAKPGTNVHEDLDSANAGSAGFTADMIVGKLDLLTNSARYQRILQAFAERGDLVTYDATSQLYYTKSYIKVDNKLAYVFMSQQGMDQLSNSETVGLDECLVLVVMPYVSSEVSAVGVGAAADATGAVTIAGTVEADAASGSATAVKASGAAESAWCLNGASLVANASPSTYPVRGFHNLSTALPQLLGKTAEELVNVLPTTATGAVGNAGTHLSDFSIIVDKAPQAIAAERTGAASLQLDGALSSHLTGADALHLKADLATVGSSALWPSGTVNGADTAGWLCANQQDAIEAGKAFLAPGGNALTPAPVTAPMAGRFHAFDGSAAAVATSVAGLTGYALWGEGCTVEFRDASGAVLSRLENVTPGSEVALPDAALDALKKPGDAMGSNVLGGWSAKPDSKPTDSGVTSVDAGVVTAPAEAGATLVLYPSYAYVPISYTMTFKDAAGKALGTLDAGANVALDQASGWYALKSELDKYVAENPSVVGWQLADGTIVATDYLAQYKPQQDGLELTAFSLTTNAGQGRLVYLVKDYDGNWKAFFNKAVNTGMEVTYNGRSDINTNFAVQVSATKTGSFTDFEPFKNWSSEYFTPEGDHVKLAQWKDVAAGGSFKVNEPIKVTDGLRYLEAVYDTHATDLETEVVYKYNYNGTVADRVVSSLTSGIGPVVAKLGTSLADALQDDDGPAPLTGYLAQDDQGQWLAYTLTGWRYGSYNQSSTAGGMVYKDASQIKLLPASSQQADPWGWKCTIDLVNDRDLRHEGRGILAVYQAAPAKLVVHWGANDAYGAASEAAWDTTFYDLRDEFEPASVPVPAGMRLKGWTMQDGDGLALGGNAVLFERAKDLVAAVGSNKTSVEVTLLPVFEAIPVDETAALRAAQNEAMKTFSMVQLAYSTMSFAYTDDQKLFLQNALDNFSDVVSMCTSTAEVDHALSTWVGMLQAQHEQAWESYLASQGGSQGGTQGGNQGGTTNGNTTTPGDQPSGDTPTVPSTGNPSGDGADNGADDGDEGDDSKGDDDKDSKDDGSSSTGTSGNKANGTASGGQAGATSYGSTSFNTPAASGSAASAGASGATVAGLGAVSSANPNESSELADSTAYRLMGCELETLTPELAEQYGLSSTEGVLVTTVEPDSAAARAGLQAGDVVKAVNGKPVTTAEELEEALAGLAEGDDVALDIERDGESLSLGVTLAPTPGIESIADDGTALTEGVNLSQQPGEESGGIIAWMVDHLVVLLLGGLLVIVAVAAVLWRVLTRRNAEETEGLDGDLWDAGAGMSA